MKIYLLVMLVAGVLTYVTVPLVRHFAFLTGTVSAPRERDAHTRPTPRLGGMAMLVGFVGAMLLAMHLPYLSAAVNVQTGWGIIVGAVSVSLLGVIDDIIDLDWLTKLAGQILAAGVMAWLGVQLVSFPVFGVTIGSSRLSLLVTVLVVVVAINAVNFVDGLDGLAAGMIGIGAVGLFIYSYALARELGLESYASLATTVTAALAGICLGFLPHNFSPATIFMGDSGAMLIGLVTAGAAIIVAGQIDPANVYFRMAFPSFLPVLLPLAVLIVPLADVIIVVIRRLVARESPFQADRRHLHDTLLRLGGTHRRAVLVLYLWTAVFSLGAASMVMLRIRTVAIIMVVACLLAALITVEFLPPLRQKLHSRSGRDWFTTRGPRHLPRRSAASTPGASTPADSAPGASTPADSAAFPPAPAGPDHPGASS